MKASERPVCHALQGLVSGFAVTAYKGARGLRGAAPKSFTWISEEAFAGF
jgi:hypothetical protein